MDLFAITADRLMKAGCQICGSGIEQLDLLREL
jgi:hypothetical protein